MKEFHKINLLYDFYGSLLTERQRNFIELYYGDDLSLGEIAEQFNVTRQAVHDTLKRAEQTLGTYEEKLALVDKFSEEYKSIEEALGLIQSYQTGVEPNGLERSKEILEKILTNRQEF
ncbi:MAG: YlxM family DNA-binding protein [Bacillota bacterium]|nr:putative DNA-binding protein [Bacillota bacterium]